MKIHESNWPKSPVILSAEQQVARERYMRLWHESLGDKYPIVEKFNHGFPSGLPIPSGCRTLEIGAGLGSHLAFEDLESQDYHCLEYRESFCEALRKKLPASRVVQGDIQNRQRWPNGWFHRILAIHVLEHLLDLPTAFKEIDRLLAPNGVLDIVIPCEGGIAHALGRKLTAERFFKKNFNMDFTPIRRSEHVNTYQEIYWLLTQTFQVTRRKFFPLLIPYHHLNFCVGFRCRSIYSRLA